MTVKLNSGLSPEWYTPNDQVGEDQQCRFLLKPLTGAQHAEVLMEMSQRNGESFLLNGKGMRLALEYGLADWDGVLDEVGAPLKFKRKRVADLPAHYHIELSHRVLNISGISEDEQKN